MVIDYDQNSKFNLIELERTFQAVGQYEWNEITVGELILREGNIALLKFQFIEAGEMTQWLREPGFNS